jgi:hypothetical protein
VREEERDRKLTIDAFEPSKSIQSGFVEERERERERERENS